MTTPVRPCWCGAGDHAINACGQFAPDGHRLPDPSLRPCSCGAPAGVTYYPRRDYWVAGCTACPTSTWAETRAEACASWNAAIDRPPLNILPLSISER